MKDKAKGLVFGIVIGTMITGTSAFAATGTKLNVMLENVKFMFNGVHKQTTQTIIYNGQLYAPVKNIAQGLGEGFTYDGANKTAWIGQKQGASKYLDELSYARIDGPYKDRLYFKNWETPKGLKFRIADQQYLHGLGAILDSYSYNEDAEVSIDYNFNGKYKKLSGYIGVDDYTKDTDNTGAIVIIGDGQELYRKEEIRGGDLPTKLDIDVSGVLKLQIQFLSSRDDGQQIDLVFGEAKLSQ
ncbi:NPCBM/NEW2 domain-containing protein [Paenibacillus tepidiphilus]|uniref:NPCBM/NEW2 domain-containing protein n=1 Tax=Paenibacillus tepidiphilus TaxID=2608683 RepID=UPI00123A9FE5|nr:NPCBM/NEW2 domain-containing protein [Paenibacillus tepidiphilus]